MDTRRDFIKKAALLSGGAGLVNSLPASIQRALQLDPALGSTYLDAEHVVILMQENRSFDHSFGRLQGVRGFNDPRAITKPDGDLVWIQKNEDGDAYIPFRLNIKETKATWLGSLPHSWQDQVDARNGGRLDQWLIAKASGHEGFEKVPLTLGYYDRNDIPFYYSLADAFTVCDQNFCSSLTGTTPNRLYLWSGTIREKPVPSSKANVSNSDVNYEKEIHWKTFPERLEENGISWKIYQNEISLESGLSDEEDSWLSNFTDNPLEWFSQYNVRFSQSYYDYLQRIEPLLPKELDALEQKLNNVDPSSKEAEELREQIKNKLAMMLKVAERHKWSLQNFEKLGDKEKAIHQKAFTTNSKDPNYRRLSTMKYEDNGEEREMQVPKGDPLFQFREDVRNGSLPAVSWIIGSANFSDHPGAPWYGAWYVSEVMDILTHQREVWKKTIFILCYDENDGYYDHVPPFVAPNPADPTTGRVSEGIDITAEYVTLEQDLKRTEAKRARQSPIGLGYRVPLVIASPWSRGGAVCSQVFDHTSILQFLEKFLSAKTGKQITESNISSWRRTVCGDLTSVFRPYNGEKINKPVVVKRDSFYESIHKAQFKKDPFGYKKLSAAEIRQVNAKATSFPLMPKQEQGTRISSPLPYELYAEGQLNKASGAFEIVLSAGNTVFGQQSAGSAFNVYAGAGKEMQVRDYAVSPGKTISDTWSVKSFERGEYRFAVNGPNGFYRLFRGNENDPDLEITVEYARQKTNLPKLSGNVELKVANLDKNKSVIIEIIDNAYKKAVMKKTLPKATGTKEVKTILINLEKSFGWFDFTVRVAGYRGFEKRYAGHVETGSFSRTDPAMGNG